jgi:hypothetical protein
MTVYETLICVAAVITIPITVAVCAAIAMRSFYDKWDV